MSDPNKDPMALLRQWMESVTEVLEGANEVPLSASDLHRFRLQRAIAAQISPTVATLDIPGRYRCDACGKGFEVFKRRLVDAHKREYSSSCPHCGSESVTDLTELVPEVSS